MVPALIYPSAVSLRERDGARLGFVTTRHDRCTPPWLAVFHVAGANQPKRSSSSSFCLCRSISVPGLAFSFVVPCHSLASPSSSSPSSLFFITLSLSLSLSLSHSLCRSEASFQKGRRCAPPTRSRVSFAAVPREAFASDAAYAENIAEVATHCPGVAVEYSFADDGVISSYYTLWHRRGRPMKPKRILPSARALSSSTPRCLASSCRAPLRIQLRFRSPCSLSLSLSLSSIPASDAVDVPRAYDETL